MKIERPRQPRCTTCAKYIGSLELECKEEIGGMCIDCFREATNQEGKWYER